VPPPQTQVEEPPMASASETAAVVIVEATSVESNESSEAFPAQVEHEVPQQEAITQPPPPPPPSFVHIEESLNKSVENVEEEVARSVGDMHEGGPAPAAQDLSDLYLSALNITAPDAPTLPPAAPTVAPIVAPPLVAERAEAL
jgi:hypothetical protein